MEVSNMISYSKQITTHFHSTEFKCKCGCGKIYIHSKLVKNLETLRTKLNASKCVVSSGYRCKKHNTKIGGSDTSQHYKGRAADVVFYDKNGKVIPSKIVLCAAFDLGVFAGMAIINTNYTHLDNRSTGKYFGDETKGYGNYWTNPYTYFGVTKSMIEKYTGKKPITYQAHGKGKKWYGNISVNSDDFAGVIGVPMDGLYIDTVQYQVKAGGRWLGLINGRSDFAGILGKPITGVAIKGDYKYRVHLRKEKRWLGWMKGANFNINNKATGFAGNGSSEIDAIQIKKL